MRVFTKHLLTLLTDLTETAAKNPDLPGLAGIELHTGRGEYGTDPGYTDLLCGASTNRYSGAHAYTSCDGQLAGGPILLPVAGAKAIIDVFKTAAKEKNPLHAVELHHDAGILRISEDPNLVDDGLSLRVVLGDLDEFPLTVYRLLSRELRTVVTNRDGRTETAAPLSTVSADVLAPFVRVAKRRGELLHVYRTHQAEPWQVQIGDDYRGVIQTLRLAEDSYRDRDRPDAVVHAPDGMPPLPDPEPAPAAADPDQTELLTPEPVA